MRPSMNIGFPAQNNNHASLDSTGSSKQALFSSGGRHVLDSSLGTSDLNRTVSRIQQELLTNMPSCSSNFLPRIAQEVLEARDFLPFQNNGLRLTDRSGLLGGAGGASSSSHSNPKAYILNLQEEVKVLSVEIAGVEKEIDLKPRFPQ